MKKKKSVRKDEDYEIFKVKKKGREKTVKIHSTSEKKPVTKKQIKEENKILRNVFITIAILFVIFLLSYLYLSSRKHIEYNGVDFDIVKEGNIMFYKTSFPVMYQGKEAVYNVYIRNNPEELDKIPFNGEIVLSENMVINMSGSDFVCDGDGVIAIANLVKPLEVFGMKIIKDLNASCDPEGRYTFMQIQPGDKTSIDKVGPRCYNLNINNCEILEVTERFLIEAFVKINQ
ncbi:hypothetical protein CMI40_00935 [Candidatus Pacearchaeota archaeon]|jgi:hypothetical protein|nr:hypothetical protein [Candidatus Pacearchaeota archaeon]|tara:strand:- start:6755 stop:7447 length:693 start_codon:yes stop_codon:yes gene_type:complete